MHGFRLNEAYFLSQIPAFQALIALGYKYLSPQTARAMRGTKTNSVLLEDILCTQLSILNRVHYKGKVHSFSKTNIQEAIQKLKNVGHDGLQKTNEAIYDLITLGTSLQQTVEGNSKSFNLNYIDWKNPKNNVFHVVSEYAVERSHSVGIAVPRISFCSLMASPWR